MTLDASGQLIVGGTTALATAANRGNITINGSSSSILTLGVGGAYKSYVFSDGTNLTLNNQPAGYIAFENNGGERARITSGGQLIVGATSAGSNLAGVQNGNGWVERDYYNSGGSSCTIVVAGDYDYIFEITACAIGNAVASQVDEGRWIAGRRDYSGANHIYNSANIVGTGISFSTSQSIVGTRCTYTLTITNTQDTANNHWMVKVRLFNNSTTLSIVFA
jgi:hypothetical protein